MSNAIHPARLDWTNDSPSSPDFGDIFFSSAGGAEESRHVFLNQNNLLERFQACQDRGTFTIAESGFGTGLNWLTTLSLWQQASSGGDGNGNGNGWLHYISAEKHPLLPEDMIRAHACWPEFAESSAALRLHYPRLMPGFHRVVFPQWRTTLTLFLGDVNTMLATMQSGVDAWFLDGFAPDRNPDMWCPDLFESMARLSHPNATFATFTAAGHVRRGLQAAGFVVEKTPGHGQKREMLRGYLPTPATNPLTTPWLYRPAMRYCSKTSLVIGAGVAGASMAARLALRGWKVSVVDAANEIAAGGSGNPAAIVYPKIGPINQTENEFAQQAWLFMQAELESGQLNEGTWNPCGVLQLLTPHQQRSLDATPDHPWIPALIQIKTAHAASQLAGIPLSLDALWYSGAGWLDARSYCQQLLTHPDITVHTNTAVAELKQTSNGWQLFDNQDQVIAEGAVVVVASGKNASAFRETGFLPLKPVPGQISTMPASGFSAQLKTVICHDGYISPALPDGYHCLGSSFHPDTESVAVSLDDHLSNHQLHQPYLPELMDSLPSPAEWKGRAAMRCQSPDYLPLVGPVSNLNFFCEDYAGLRDGKVMDYPLPRTQSGLYVSLAHGSRGFMQSLLCAEILASEICNEPAPVSHKVLNAIHPMRFAVRDLKRKRI
jgi:tRNA 5-methylaminomethyl-2-thiouridine biosynthesis bifunctional protein